MELVPPVVLGCRNSGELGWQAGLVVSQLVVRVLAILGLPHLVGCRLDLHQVPPWGVSDEVIREVRQKREALLKGRHILVGQR